jgi:hypothetical protein
VYGAGTRISQGIGAAWAWEIIRLKACCPFLGIVYALDEKAALKQAITEFAIRPEDEWRLLVRKSRAWRAG